MTPMRGYYLELNSAQHFKREIKHGSGVHGLFLPVEQDARISTL